MKNRMTVRQVKLIILIWLVISLYAVIALVINGLHSNHPPVSPFTDQERTAGMFASRMGWGKYDQALRLTATSTFRPYHPSYFSRNEKQRCGILETDTKGVLYQRESSGETVLLSVSPIRKTGVFYARFGPGELLFFRNMDKEDRIVNFWEDELTLEPEEAINTVCFEFKSGAVLQVASTQLLNNQYPGYHGFVVVRIFFTADRLKSDFPCAYFLEEGSHPKGIMNKGQEGRNR